MKQHHILFSLLTFLLPVVLLAADDNKGYALTDFMRADKQEGQKYPASFDTAIVKFADEKKNIQVDLVGAVHIGDKEYYAELNKIFKQYDAVLYELVAEENTKPPISAAKSGGNDNRNILSSFQSGMGNALALDFQLNHIDYHAKNMVHADLNPSEFARRVSDRGDFAQMIYRTMLLGIKKSGQESQNDELKMQGRLLGSFFAPNPALSLKRVLAGEMMNQMDEAAWVVGGEGSAIITDRNAAALKVLRRELNKGKKKIAIFYGAAHLAEFAKSLEKDFQMKQTSTDWIIAWDLTKDKTARNK